MGFVVSGTYTYHTPSGYIFRLRIPKDLGQLSNVQVRRNNERCPFIERTYEVEQKSTACLRKMVSSYLGYRFHN